MPYIERDAENRIKAIYAQLQEGYAEEFLEDDAPDLTAFFNPSPAVSDYQAAIQAEIDATARAKDFNDGVTLASYVNSTVQPWAAQAQAFVAWRDNVWQIAYSELAKVQAGEREQPSVSDFLLELPEIVWL